MKYIYEGLGFPIELDNIEMKKFYFSDELQPVIDVKKVVAQVIKEFNAPDYTFTGNQLAFIRTYLKMNEEQFAKLLAKPVVEINLLASRAEQPIQLDAQIESALKQRLQKQCKVENESLLGKQSMFSAKRKNPPEPDDQNLPNKKPKK